MSFIGRMVLNFYLGHVEIIYGPDARCAVVRWDDQPDADPCCGWWLRLDAKDENQRILLTADGNVDCYEAGGLATTWLARTYR